MKPDEPFRPDPDALLAQAKRQGRGRLKVYLGMAPGVGKTFEMLSAAPPRGRGRGRRGRGGRNPRPQGDRGPARGAGGPAAPADRLPRAPAHGVRPRRGPGPQAGPAAGGRIRPLQRARLAPPQALAGRGGAARPPASTSGRRSTSSIWRAWSTWCGRSPGCGCARRCRTRRSPPPTRSNWSI